MRLRNPTLQQRVLTQRTLRIKMNLPYSQNAGLYIHIPFCVKKCAYCDFYSVTDLALKPRFLKALLREMELVSHEGLCFDTLYIGGGTPSVYDYNEISQIVTAAFRNFDLLPESEITLEVNPGTATKDQLTGYRAAGINRLNIGVQSLQQKHLDFLGRIHTVNEAHTVIQDANHAGFKNIGLDFIYGLPEQSKPDWLQDLELAIEYDPAHLSCYMLTYENGTPLHSRLQAGQVQALPDDNVRTLFETTIDFLEGHKYFQYEISNFAKIGEDKETHVSRHNLKYWTLVPYIGLGPSAHSFIKRQRYWNVSSVGPYLEAIESDNLPVSEKEVLSLEQQMIETIYLGLRMTRGIDLVGFKEKFGINFFKAFKEIIPDLEKRNYIKVIKNHCVLTQQGRAFLDSITSMFITQDVPTTEVKI